MAASEMKAAKYTWGEVVEILDPQQPGLGAKTTGSVCGITTVETHSMAQSIHEPVGTVMYTVELASGESMLVAERFLESLEQVEKNGSTR